MRYNLHNNISASTETLGLESTELKCTVSPQCPRPVYDYVYSPHEAEVQKYAIQNIQ